MKLALCLAGGGVKGAAHVGVLKALEERKIKFDYITGASSGSIVATLNAVGYQSDDIYQIFNDYCYKIKYVDIKNIFKLGVGLIFKRKLIIEGLNSGEAIEKIMCEVCAKKSIYNINQIHQKLLIPSISLNDGKIYFFSSFQNRSPYSDNIVYVNDMNIGKCVRASCSYPGVFEPCRYQDIPLVDGGIRENIPWKIAKECGADKVLCVAFESDKKIQKKINIIDVISNSLGILCHELSSYELYGADYLLKIKTKEVSLLDTSKIDYLYNEGYQQTKKFLSELILE